MNLTLYLTIQQVIMGALMALGLQLIFGFVPKGLKGSRVEISGRVMGVAMMIIPLASFIYFFSGMLHLGPEYATAINLTAYCLTSTIVAIAYYILLEAGNRGFVKALLIVGLIYPFPLWFGVCFGNEAVAKHTLIASYTLFCVLSIIHIASCLHLYRKMVDMSNEDISSLQEVELLLLGRTLNISLGLIIVSMLAPSFYSYPLWLGMIFVTLFVVGVIYIYICYHKILSWNINSLIGDDQEIVDPEESGDSSYVSDLATSNIENHLNEWIARKEFAQPGISINYVAKSAYTNRTYLSRYINQVYNCSFRVWITQLRIDEAKELLRTHRSLSISAVAKRAGFASVESFSHIFTRMENRSPSKWREMESK